jgi:ATP-dependent Clp protease ATP-binding subunit ClpC
MLTETRPLTDRATRVTILARKEAQRFNHPEISPPIILIGLTQEKGGLAFTVFDRLGINTDQLADRIRETLERRSELFTQNRLPYTAEGQKVINGAREEAESLQDTYVGTEHLLLGLFHSEDDSLLSTLHEFQVNKEVVKGAIIAERTQQTL